MPVVAVHHRLASPMSRALSRLAMHPPHGAVKGAAWRNATVWALMLALYFASTLGLVHRTVHGLPAAPPGLAASFDGGSVSHAQAAATPSAATSTLAALFGLHTAGHAECRLYDQLAHGAAAPSVPLVVLPMVLPPARFVYCLGEALARWVALFDARGPPLSR